MRRTNKKGFTIVELVIVIAVIAILAAVLIPTFASLVNKANRSADIQAVRQMNTYLASNEVDGGKNITDAYAALEEGGMTAKDYHPLASDTYFFWDAKENRVLYTDKNYTVLYPEEYKGHTYTASEDTWRSLSGEIEEIKVEVKSNAASVSSAGELYYLSENLPADLTTITLTGDVDLMGANVAFKVPAGRSLTIDGGSHTIKGLVSIESKYTDPKKGKEYAAGLIAKVEDNAGTVTLKNITIENAVVGGLEIGGVGALVGRIEQNVTVTIDNCKVLNSTVYGKNKVGAMVGSAGSGTLTIKNNCEVNGVTVNCSEGESGLVVGNVYQGTAVIEASDFEWVKNSTLNLVQDSEYPRDTMDVTEVKYTANTSQNEANQTDSGVVSGIQKLVRVLDGDNEMVPEMKNEKEYWRMFTSDAYITVHENGIVCVGGESGTAYCVNSYKAGTYTVGTDSKDISINILSFVK